MKKENNMVLTSIFVDYFSHDISNQFIMNLLNKTPNKFLDNISFVVVDNSLDNQNFDNLSKYFDSDYDEEIINELIIRKVNINYNNFIIPIIYLKNNCNSGYGRGNNLGVEVAKKYFEPKYLIISNNDMLCQDDHVDYEKVLDIFENHLDVGIVGVNIKNLDGSLQNPYCYMNITKRWIYPELLFPFKRKKYSGSDLIKNAKSDYVYRVRGSFMFLRSEAFYQCGGFDDNIFLYCEEPILSERLLKIGYKNYYLDEIHMLHNHVMDGNKLTSSYVKKIKNRFQSEMYYYKNYIKESRFNIFLAKILFPIYLLKFKLFNFIRSKKKKKEN